MPMMKWKGKSKPSPQHSFQVEKTQPQPTLLLKKLSHLSTSTLFWKCTSTPSWTTPQLPRLLRKPPVTSVGLWGSVSTGLPAHFQHSHQKKWVSVWPPIQSWHCSADGVLHTESKQNYCGVLLYPRELSCNTHLGSQARGHSSLKGSFYRMEKQSSFKEQFRAETQFRCPDVALEKLLSSHCF